MEPEGQSSIYTDTLLVTLILISMLAATSYLYRQLSTVRQNSADYILGNFVTAAIAFIITSALLFSESGTPASPIGVVAYGSRLGFLFGSVLMLPRWIQASFAPTVITALSGLENKFFSRPLQDYIGGVFVDWASPSLIESTTVGKFIVNFRRILRDFVRLCLFVGIEPIFIPFKELQRNYWVEQLSGLWGGWAFWKGYQFRSFYNVQHWAASFTYLIALIQISVLPSHDGGRRSGKRVELIAHQSPS